MAAAPVSAQLAKIWRLPERLAPTKLRVPGRSPAHRVGLSLWKVRAAPQPRFPDLCVFLAHANGFSKESWEPTVQELDSLFTAEGLAALPGWPHRNLWVAAADSASHGESSVDLDIPYTWWGAAADLVGAAEYLCSPEGPLPGSTQLLGCGLSGGALQLLMGALLRPGLFHSMMVMEPPLFGPDPWMLSQESPMAKGARNRRAVWPGHWGQAELFDYFRSRSLFRELDERAVWAYVRGSMIRRGEALQQDDSARANPPDPRIPGVDYQVQEPGAQPQQHPGQPSQAPLDPSEWVLRCPAFAEAEFFSQPPTPYCWSRLGEVRRGGVRDSLTVVYGSASTMFPFQPAVVEVLSGDAPSDGSQDNNSNSTKREGKDSPSVSSSSSVSKEISPTPPSLSPSSSPTATVTPIVLRGVGHLIPMERPALVAGLIRTMLRDHVQRHSDDGDQNQHHGDKPSVAEPPKREQLQKEKLRQSSLASRL